MSEEECYTTASRCNVHKVKQGQSHFWHVKYTLPYTKVVGLFSKLFVFIQHREVRGYENTSVWMVLYYQDRHGGKAIHHLYNCQDTINKHSIFGDNYINFDDGL